MQIDQPLRRNMLCEERKKKKNRSPYAIALVRETSTLLFIGYERIFPDVTAKIIHYIT